ncbi:MAG: CHASE2 domain-containing protein [Brasilonema angustatum HA4187-MV1]|jgi:CHASE2 domain-containing sensor protein|nr:CHASE2 domain-containing protein [Brasilonema angustatum HA4187-MV1]
MSLEDLNDSDIETLRKFLQLSGRTAPDRRRALCIEIGINPGELSAIWLLPPNDFAVELIYLLQTRRLENSVSKLCEELKSAFRGGEYAPQLDAIAYKLNPHYNSELNSEPDYSTSTTQPPTQYSNQFTQPPSETEVTKATLPGRTKGIHLSLLRRFNLKTVFTASLTITVALVGLRFFGVLESLELKTFDHLIQLRPDEGIDKRLLIVKITDDDILAQDKRGEKGQGSLRDPSLNRLLQILEQHKPRLIGIDLYRPFSADSNIPDFLKRLGQNNIIAVCKVPIIDEQGNPQKEVAPPKEVSTENISFSDFVSDTDDTVRRHLMFQDWVPGAKCRTEESFSFMLARRYLEQELKENSNYQDTLTSGNNLQLGGVVFPQLQPFTGGYQDVDAAGFQVLLNYRATSSGEVAKELTLEEILNNNFQDEDLRDKIILIGSYAEQQGPPDRWSTPYGTLSGVIVHAHMISQVLSTALDKRPLLSVWSQGGEILWIWSWSLIGAVFACYWRSFKPLAIAVGSGIIVLSVTCWFSLTFASVWIPLIPPALGLVGTSSVVIYIVSFFPRSPKQNTYK